jgi:flagellar biogenesis protein FliO
MGSYGAYVLQTFLTLAVVCGLAFVILYGARRLGIGRASGPIRLVGQLPLDARRYIYLVRVGAQVIVVGVGEGGFTKLGEVPAADLPPDAPARPAAFADVLKRVMGKGAASEREGAGGPAGGDAPKDARARENEP